MNSAIKGLKPERVWSYFQEISKIPRESGNEEGMRQYLLAFAKQHSLKAVTDTVGNVIIRKPASKGFENRPSVALQGHMDMVCVKTKESKHNFLTDPIDLVLSGDYLHAKDTTLGGDNGIAIAIALDILSDDTAEHGPLEGIFTVSEETGLTGAFGIQKEHINSRLMLNLDSEEEGVLYIGCAGGIEVDVQFSVKQETIPAGYLAFSLSSSGMLGGHSGGEIHKQRANAIKILARALVAIPTKMLISAEGGTKRNVIPSSCSFSFAVPEADKSKVEAIVEETAKALSIEYAISDPDITLELTPIVTPAKAANAKQSEDFVRSLYIAPHGVDAMSLTIPGIVETSSNLAIIRFANDSFTVISSHRSSVLSARDDIAHRLGEAFCSCGAKVTYEGAYPSWTPNPASKLTAFCAKAYEEYTNTKPVITAIHAGLECGIINSLVPGMDSVSFGPNMYDVHSVKEKISVSSVERIYGFTRHLLSMIK
ncbi:aminoacyl-histidine dipeptidase [uncultured Sphaerochaeta sp.]|uniref:aminoacyl-histidine dipeptidase n=1 Tax=uncultured Sphaerochaeta sp. TaxID=886478 RepID=UPI002A0A3467|nr:aminoacyl-histidine dipeptidase [uncultured Sphaerochaeta sp.]